MSSVLTITTVDQLYELATRLSGEDSFTDTVEFGGELANLLIKFDGKNYKSSLPSNAMAGLVELQKSLYRAAAQALYGSDNAAKLTQEDKDALLLTFTIKEGSTDVASSLKNFLEKLAEGFPTMDSKHKLIAIVAVVAMLVGGYTTKSLIESNNENTLKIEQEKTKIELEKQRTEQMKLMLKGHASLSSIHANIESGLKAVVQGAADADKITINESVFNKDVIASLVERSKRRPTSAELIDGQFAVTNINTSLNDVFKLGLRRIDSLQEFIATLEKSEFTQEEKHSLWLAASNVTPISLKINITKAGDSIKSATIEEIIV
jgi:hypothetical protein